jgi:hypothetical protein
MRYGVSRMSNFITTAISKLVNSIITFFVKMRGVLTRSFISYTLMVGFIIFTSVGAGVISPAFGFIVAGVTCGILGFLLGIE